MSMTEPIRDKNQLRQLAGYWLERNNYRNYTLIVLGVCTALRTGDLLRLEWDDVCDDSGGGFRSHITIIEMKTRKKRTIALNAQAITALTLLYPYRRGNCIFANNRKEEDNPISRIQAWRIIKTAAESAGLTGCISTHSLRKSFGYFAYKSGVLPVLLMDLYNHTSFEVTRRYLGIAQDDRDKVYLNMALF